MFLPLDSCMPDHTSGSDFADRLCVCKSTTQPINGAHGMYRTYLEHKRQLDGKERGARRVGYLPLLLISRNFAPRGGGNRSELLYTAHTRTEGLGCCRARRWCGFTMSVIGSSPQPRGPRVTAASPLPLPRSCWLSNCLTV